MSRCSAFVIVLCDADRRVLEETCPRVHACARAGGAGQDRAVGCRWCGEHGDRRAIGRTRRCCESMAEALPRRRGSTGWRIGSGRVGRGCLPRRWSRRSRQWRVRRRANARCRCRGGVRPGPASPARDRGPGGVGVGLDGAAMAGRGRDQAVAVPVMDLPANPASTETPCC